MTKMTKAQAKRRLNEAQAKFRKVYIDQHSFSTKTGVVVKTADMEAVEKVVARCLKRLG